jgi:membrane protein
MKLIDPRTTYVIKNPVAFSLRVLKGFQINQGLLLAGAVAYYALLSIVPLLILIVIALSQLIDQNILLATLNRALEYVVPGESKAVVTELRSFLDHREVIGWVLFITMLFFSSLGFKVLESAISVIFTHRVEHSKRHILVSLLVLPFGYIFFISAMLFLGTFLIVDLMAIGSEHIVILGHSWSLGGFSRWLIYIAGVFGEILLISSIYYFMPVGRLTARHALIGGPRLACSGKSSGKRWPGILALYLR